IAMHGPLGKWVTLDPVTQMILAILDGRTREETSTQAFLRLCMHCPRWEDVLGIPADTIERLIQPVMYAQKKAGQIHGALQKITNYCGTLNLDFLQNYPVNDARAWLEDLPGVGPKVSAAVVNFSTLHMPALVVDSHYMRVARRLGFVAADVSDNVVHRSLARLVPDEMTADDLEQHYFVVKRLGQTVCHRSAPACHACPLRTICPTGKRRCGEL
ncbi:MAG: endonuclease III domain-containing protein, partial [Hyphomicrobiaceae bacterium]